jgi:hypothetical protein
MPQKPRQAGIAARPLRIRIVDHRWSGRVVATTCAVNVATSDCDGVVELYASHDEQHNVRANIPCEDCMLPNDRVLCPYGNHGHGPTIATMIPSSLAQDEAYPSNLSRTDGITDRIPPSPNS